MQNNSFSTADCTDYYSKSLIVLPEIIEPKDRDLFELSVKRIRENKGCFDVIHSDIPGNNSGMYDMVVILGVADSRPELYGLYSRQAESLSECSTECVPDTYIIRTVKKDPLTVAVAGMGARGMLYAAYCFADILKSDKEKNEINICRSPKIKDRYALLTTCTFGGQYFKPGLYYKTLNELPRYGYNGVVVVPGGQCGTPVDRNEPPVKLSDNGEISIDKFKMTEWKEYFKNIKKYGMDIALSIAPIVPPGFGDREIDDFYMGGGEPEGYLKALSDHFEKFLQVIFETYGEIDMVIFSSTEGSEFGKCKRFFLAPENVDKDNEVLEAYLENNAVIVKTYFDIMDNVCRKYSVKAGFWTHIYGIVTPGLIKLREVIFQYPDIFCLEDDYWNNNLWIYDLPVMSYLPEAYRKIVAENSRFAMAQWCTDGEYYGGGSLLNSYPDTYLNSAKEAVRLEAGMLMQRLNLHDRTISGTLYNSVEIIPYAASRQIWEPVSELDDLWVEWAERRYGKDASAYVIKALKNSKDFMLKGLQVNGYFLTMHSSIRFSEWKAGSICFKLFGKPGKLLVSKTYNDIITSKEYAPFQMKTTAIGIDEFRCNNDYALEKINESRKYIEKVRDFLSEGDYTEFVRIFQDSEIVLGILRRLGEAAYAANLVLDNFDVVEDPAGLLKEALQRLENYNETVVRSRGDDLMNPPVYENVKEIADSYRQLINI